ncbi:MAG: 16S rRNA (cytidine(1402)-2'-O)-methyltransferase [Pelagibacteraceae bacterium TMED216]|nr:MAG: 16S rRNA (cytidine(1402)-2'-O)-methyltransferase [Pelagibacteraceae bacterium TMED216]|tara:strand:+ start:2168 stop:2995 length:828 start_codon:yes stop_codon:yes gene_type:complete
MSEISKGLYIVSTPIGNLEDVTLRSLNILKKSDIILCEDTRRTLKLLNYYKIKKKLISYHKFNEKKELQKIIKYLKLGKILSLVSDAGTPNLSDPGRLLVKECISEKINIVPIPGPSSITAAMSVSGFDDKFLFYGFLPKKDKELGEVLKKLKDYNYTLIFFIQSVRMNYYLKAFKAIFKTREILIAREMTKLHETFYRGNLENLKYFPENLKGELTVLISKTDNVKKIVDKKEIKELVIKNLKKFSVKDTVKIINKKTNVSKKTLYKICLEEKK